MDKWIELNKGLLNLEEYSFVNKPELDGTTQKWFIKLTYKRSIGKSPKSIICGTKIRAEETYNSIKSALFSNPIHSGKFLV